MTRLTGKDLEEARDLMRERKGGEPPTNTEVEAVLRHLHGGGDLMDLAVVDEMLEADADVYAGWVSEFWTAYPPTAAGEGGTTLTLAHPATGLQQVITVRQLKGRDMDLALHNGASSRRLALMTGLEADQVRRMDLADVMGLEAAAAPFLTRVLRALNRGGASPAGS